jgi:uncharacterized membrane protein (DUF485 family)
MMKRILTAVFAVALFIAFTPGVLCRLPTKASNLTAAVVHGLLFALTFSLTYNMVWTAAENMEDLDDMDDDMEDDEDDV